jgi:hypothetical protein
MLLDTTAAIPEQTETSRNQRELRRYLLVHGSAINQKPIMAMTKRPIPTPIRSVGMRSNENSAEKSAINCR